MLYHLQLKHHKWRCLSHPAALKLVNGVNPREGSLELLQTGQDSDCRVRCGTKEWTTHQSMIIQCPEIHKQLLGFDRTVVIKCLTPWQTQICLDYLYQHGKIDLAVANNLNPNRCLPQTIVHLHTIAKLMNLPDLASYARCAFLDWENLILGHALYPEEMQKLATKQFALEVESTAGLIWLRHEKDPCRFPEDMVDLMCKLSRLLGPFDFLCWLRKNRPDFALEYDRMIAFFEPF